MLGLLNFAVLTVKLTQSQTISGRNTSTSNRFKKEAIGRLTFRFLAYSCHGTQRHRRVPRFSPDNPSRTHRQSLSHIAIFSLGTFPLPAAAGSFAPGRSSSSSSSSSCVVASVDRSSVSDACQELRHLAQAFLLRLATCHSSSSSASADAVRGRFMAAPGASAGPARAYAGHGGGQYCEENLLFSTRHNVSLRCSHPMSKK